MILPANSMDTPVRHRNLRERISLIAATAIGPIFLVVGYRAPPAFAPAAVGYILVCFLIVPLLTAAGGRFKFLAWQLAIFSIDLAVIGDNLRLNAIHRSEIPPTAFVFWAGGTLLSSPLPVYFLLKPLAPRRRWIVGIMVILTALLLWLAIKRITG
jgi:hypothetical protein